MTLGTCHSIPEVISQSTTPLNIEILSIHTLMIGFSRKDSGVPYARAEFKTRLLKSASSHSSKSLRISASGGMGR